MSTVRQIIEAEVADSTLVIHMDDRSTDFLKAIYQGRGYPVMSERYSRQQLLEAIKAHSRVFMLGHGGPSGLFSRNFMIDDSFGPALAEKSEGLYIWCNADAYAKRNKLSGLVSGMFVSEVGEASMFGIHASQQEVTDSNNAFARIVREHLDSGHALSNVRQCYTSAACKITQFNSERLYIFDHGSPTPALHTSSLAHPQPPRERYDWPELEREPNQELDKDHPDIEAWFGELQDLLRKEGVRLSGLSAYDYEALMDELMELFYTGYSPAEAVQVFMTRY